MYCPSCGEELAEERAFCSGCGAEIDADEPPPETATAGPDTAQAGATAPGRTARSTETAGGLDANVAGTLSYVLGFVTGLVFLLIEDEDEFVRFHAAQSIVVFGGLMVFGFAISFFQGMIGFGGIAYVGWMLVAVLGLVSFLVYAGSFVLWILLMVKAYNGERYSLPIAGGFAEKLV